MRAAVLVALAAASAFANSDRDAFISDVRARAAALDAPTPRDARRVLIEASAAAVARKGDRLRAHYAAGHLGDVYVNTSYGSLIGIGGGNATVNQFLGVPFAAPPIGALRWKAPQPPAPWGTRNAQWFAPSCMQSEVRVMRERLRSLLPIVSSPLCYCVCVCTRWCVLFAFLSSLFPSY